jgi:ribosomal protein S27AE
VPKKPRARTERRLDERAQEKLARDREKLAHLEPGGSPERPVPLDSASQVEVHARSLTCTRCGSDLRLDEHAALTMGDQRLRVARLTCPRCGVKREAWFRIAPALPS